MRVWKTKEFSRYARKEKISDTKLCEAIERAERGLVDAELGGGLIKQRVARPGEGRSGGYRTIVAYRSDDRSVFLFGFAKSGKANLSDAELAVYKQLAAVFLASPEDELLDLASAGELTEIECDGD